MSAFDLPDVLELCTRLHRETNAHTVLVLGPEGEILGHAGSAGALEDVVLDAIGDVVAQLLGQPQPPPEPDAEDTLRQAGATQLCASPLANRALLLVVFDDVASAGLVRLRMKRARELLLRSLEAS